MADSERNRRALFLAGLAVLVLWAAALALLGSGAGEDPGQGAGGVSPARAAGQLGTKADRSRSAAARAAVEFLSVYLPYEVGSSSPADRKTLARLSTPGFNAQLRRAHVGAPSAAPAREWVSRVEGVRIGIFEGEQALFVAVFVVGPGGGHLVTPTLLQRGSRWLIAGLGE